MAFVDVTVPKSPAGAAALLLQGKSGKRQFTPELCLDVLHVTNFAKNMRDMLTMIEELPPSEQKAFKEVVLSTFERRKQPNDVVILGKKLAVSSGYEAEFNNVGKAGVAEGEYLFSGVGKRVGIAITAFDEREDYSSYEEVSIITDDVDLSYYDLAQVKNLRFKDGAKIDLRTAINLPESLDVSMCERVNLSKCDLALVKNLRFKEGADICLKLAKNLPAELDVSMCGRVNLEYCDLASVKSLRFREGAKAYLNGARNFSADLDVSMCQKVELKKFELFNVKHLHFKDQAQMIDSWAEIPDTVNVTYRNSDGSNVPFWSRVFGKGGR